MMFSNPLLLGPDTPLESLPFGALFVWHGRLMVKRKWTQEEKIGSYAKYTPAVCICMMNGYCGQDTDSGETIKIRSVELVAPAGVVKETRYSIKF